MSNFKAFDKEIINKNFSRAAKNYSELATIQNLVAEKLVKMCDNFITNNSTIIDLGCGTGFLRKNILKEKNPQIFECDLSANMLGNAICKTENNLKIQCDFNQLPFAKNSFDIVISSFSLQWIEDFPQFFKDIYKILKPSGKLIFAIPTQESLKELKYNQIFHFNKLPEADLLRLLSKKHLFQEIDFYQDTLKQSFDSPISAIKFIKNIGANYSEISHNTITKNQLSEFNSFYLKNCADRNKTFEISWHVSFFLLENSATAN